MAWHREGAWHRRYTWCHKSKRFVSPDLVTTKDCRLDPSSGHAGISASSPGVSAYEHVDPANIKRKLVVIWVSNWLFKNRNLVEPRTCNSASVHALPAPHFFQLVTISWSADNFCLKSCVHLADGSVTHKVRPHTIFFLYLTFLQFQFVRILSFVMAAYMWHIILWVMVAMHFF